MDGKEIALTVGAACRMGRLRLASSGSPTNEASSSDGEAVHSIPYAKEEFMGTGKTTATLWAQDGRIRIRSDYNTEFIDAFKQMVPPQHRSWMPKPDKLWTCEPSYLDDVYQLCQKFFDDVSILEEGGGDAAGGNGVDGNPYEALLKHASDDFLKKVHRSLIKACHPDKGGDAKIAAQVNAAWKRIREERGM